MVSRNYKAEIRNMEYILQTDPFRQKKKRFSNAFSQNSHYFMLLSDVFPTSVCFSSATYPRDIH